MKKILSFAAVAGCLLFCSASRSSPARGGWIQLFDGKSLDGWKVGENAETFSVQNGCIVAHGKTAHLFYVGDVQGHDFKNFDLKAEVMTEPESSIPIHLYFAPSTQEERAAGPRAKGYEVQVNNSHTDWRRTGSVYGVEDIKEVYVKDKVWFTEEAIVRGKHIVIKLNGKTVVDYTEPEHVERPKGSEGRVLSSGTFALQGHDPNSIVYFKNIRVKVLE